MKYFSIVILTLASFHFVLAESLQRDPKLCIPRVSPQTGRLIGQDCNPKKTDDISPTKPSKKFELQRVFSPAPVWKE